MYDGKDCAVAADVHLLAVAAADGQFPFWLADGHIFCTVGVANSATVL